MTHPSLRREIGLFGAVAYGVGIIIGAGVYALIGVGAGRAGNAIWISFTIAALIASFTGISYAILSSRYPDSAAEYIYVEKAFGSTFWAFVVGWMVILTGLLSSATVALGFGGYLRPYTGLPEVVMAILLIIVISLVNFLGIKESIRMNIVLTLVEVSGIVLIIIFGASQVGTVDYLETPMGSGGIVAAVAIIFFAFLGFEDIVKLGEETKSRDIIPKALLTSLLFSTILYIALSVVVISVVPFDELATSSSPLADVALRSQGESAAALLSGIALIATANTVLIMQIATSRIAYGMANQRSLPSAISSINRRRGTPWVAITVVAGATCILTLLGSIETIAEITNLLIFAVFFVVNISLLNIQRRTRGVDRKGFLARKYAIIPLLGAASSIFLLLQFQIDQAIIALILIAIGAGIFLSLPSGRGALLSSRR